MVPTFTRQPFDGVGAQLCSCSIATATPQTFTVASRSATLSDKEFPESGMRCSAAVIHQVQAAGSLEELSAAGSSTYAFPSRLPDAGHLAVLTSSVVVRAAFHRPLRPEVQAALSFDMPATTGIRRCSLITARLVSASWRSMSATHRRFGASASKRRSTRSGAGRTAHPGASCGARGAGSPRRCPRRASPARPACDRPRHRRRPVRRESAARRTCPGCWHESPARGPSAPHRPACEPRVDVDATRSTRSGRHRAHGPSWRRGNGPGSRS